MTRDHALTAIKECIPFQIKMADGGKYEVTDAHRIAAGRTNAVVMSKGYLPPFCHS